jgi:hypothetical protein
MGEIQTEYLHEIMRKTGAVTAFAPPSSTTVITQSFPTMSFFSFQSPKPKPKLPPVGSWCVDFQKLLEEV